MDNIKSYLKYVTQSILTKSHLLDTSSSRTLVGIATSYGLEGPGFESWTFQNAQTVSGTYPAFYSTAAVVKQAGRAVNHSPPSSAAVKNGWSYTSAPYMSPLRGQQQPYLPCRIPWNSAKGSVAYLGHSGDM